MESLLALIGMAIVLFASTNVDDVFVLAGFFADKRFRTRDTVLGQYVGITALFSASVAASLLSLVISRAYIGLLGMVPILIGGKKLFELHQPRDRTKETLDHHVDANRGGRVATVALVTLANGGDNIGICTPSFAFRSAHKIIVIALVFAVMTALWCFVAHAIVNHPKLGSPIRRYGQRVTPVVLVGLGVLLLYQAGSFGLLLGRSGF
ncbi:cadmium resistance transporter [Granulicella sp. S190]|uniref:cadmium resistance transporter n=1 Tax=Granulicella sp. S190 TaxID=1747226 RepID=UPI001576E129|nr:cadmium resistance transporter [Granulicella sp. S190]